jgi:aerobic-type carbon monoxide dehydrogenase small subunit (CoxS/CutS family)
MAVTVIMTVNGAKRTVTTDPSRSLLDVLREDLGVTGPKYGCGEGQCGACSVLLDGRCVKSCIIPVAQAHGQTVTTIEGLASGDTLHPIQEAFLEEGALQCGYCTGGMIIAASALLKRTPHPTDEQITAAMNGNICRCNGYTKILRAVRRAAAKLRT